ncbi:DegT/DnrJ/EryC1/StrS family aminotransferase [Cellulomonas chengniuliangii]|uniref:DegT/DnrJ/EryC1/StrS family aminotransferase n=1 Tax=Cellulomonas chengniuliangii TaxID=2968084 RepID=A0ABY5KZ83_9CELL|nr:DegT/DnrJ/EryC1/StrS family aminotransferase [Cellulomonas chengniuliangii]MCC2310064.1 DegT/DnrJ/EryC1/StrS family aminotransferase [Cellulomonas chengniuliangii]UUI74541.1 DegT/DnrJ/EryC1/StrS family aminotransferase [Cellulomonas chengniuliangii]
MIYVASPDLTGNEKAYVNECMDSTWISSSGHFITDFERRFADACGVKHAIATNNGTTALHLALAVMGIGPGDEVIVPVLTYIATANAVRYCGAEPVFVDVESDTMNMDPAQVRLAITERTKAIIPVDLYGHPSDINAINAIADEHGIAVLADSAEAHGAEVDGRRVGSLAFATAFSFFGNKILTTGEGGAVTTDDDDFAARLRLLRGQGMDPTRRYWFPEVGFNYRMTNIAAAIGVAQLERFDDILDRRDQIAKQYDSLLAELPGVTLPAQRAGMRRVNWLYTVTLDGVSAEQRDTIIRALDGEGIETRPVFHPLHHLPPYAHTTSYPEAERLGATGISLPTHLGLTEADITTVADSLAAQLVLAAPAR